MWHLRQGLRKRTLIYLRMEQWYPESTTTTTIPPAHFVELLSRLLPPGHVLERGGAWYLHQYLVTRISRIFEVAQYLRAAHPVPERDPPGLETGYPYSTSITRAHFEVAQKLCWWEMEIPDYTTAAPGHITARCQSFFEEGIRCLARRGGVTDFDTSLFSLIFHDMVAISAWVLLSASSEKEEDGDDREAQEEGGDDDELVEEPLLRRGSLQCIVRMDYTLARFRVPHSRRLAPEKLAMPRDVMRQMAGFYHDAFLVTDDRPPEEEVAAQSILDYIQGMIESEVACFGRR